jgi:hypothetical protein
MAGVLPAHAKEYKYTPLRENQIRLLRLYPPSGDDTLVGELVSVPIIVDDEGLRDNVATNYSRPTTPNPSPSPDARNGDHTPEYEAVSYVWGGDDIEAKNGRHFICIFLAKKTGAQSDNKDAAYLPITPNLEASLKEFRSQLKPGEDLYLWVDAICMNQRSDLEKSFQIRMMADIYMQARCVRIWLGSDDTKCRGQAAFKFMQEILTFHRLDNLVQRPIASHEWDAFRYLMQNSWFKRRWIVQEISFAKRAHVYLGHSDMKWEDMKGAISLFVDVNDQLRQMFQQSSDHFNNPDFLGEVKAFGAKTLVDVIKLMFRKSSKGWIMENLLSLEYLLTTLTPFDAKLPHDSVYAVMRLSNDARPGANLKGTDLYANDRTPTAWPKSSRGSDLAPSSKLSTTKSAVSGFLMEASALAAAPPDKRPGSTSPDRGRKRERLDLGRDAAGRPHSRARDPSPAVARREAEGEYRKPLREFVVDYRQSMLSLCKDVYSFVVEQSSSIDIICKPWVPDIDKGDENTKVHEEDRKMMPSWIQPLSRRPFGVSSVDNQRYARLAAEPLVGTTRSGFRSYSASGIKPVPDSFIPGKRTGGTLIDGRTLNARGFVLDTIGKTAYPALDATVPKDWPRFAGWRGQNQDLPSHFWTTLVANRKSSEGPELPPDHWPHACKWTFLQRAKNGNLAINSILANVYQKPSDQVRPFLHRVREVIWDRKLFWTGKLQGQDPRLGLAPPEAGEGDLICILYGCSVPVILRPKKASRSRSRSREDRRHGTRKTSRLGGVLRTPSRSRDVPNVMNAVPTTPKISVSSAGSLADNPAIVEPFIPSPPSTSSIADQDNDRLPAAAPRPQIYTFIGECYVDGMMDGEAFHQKKSYSLIERDFKIGCMEDCDCDECEGDGVV